MEHIYDMIIIGGGPAGYTAALYAARAGLDLLLLEKAGAGGQMALTDTVDNYPGFDEGIDGFTLGMKMKNGAERFGAKTVTANVLSAKLDGDIKTVVTAKNTFCAKTVIIAVGADPKKLGLPKEDELTGRGVHYCAHCDGRFYKGKTVAVIGGGNTAVSDALYIARLAKKVFLIHRRDTLRADKIYAEQIQKTENIEFCRSASVDGLIADERLTGINLKDIKTGKVSEVKCDGLFVSIGRTPPTGFLEDKLALDESGYIKADETTRTNIPGVFAAGDVRTKALRQIVTAVSDGAAAVHFAEEYLG